MQVAKSKEVITSMILLMMETPKHRSVNIPIHQEIQRKYNSRLVRQWVGKSDTYPILLRSQIFSNFVL